MGRKAKDGVTCTGDVQQEAKELLELLPTLAAEVSGKPKREPEPFEEMKPVQSARNRKRGITQTQLDQMNSEVLNYRNPFRNT